MELVAWKPAVWPIKTNLYVALSLLEFHTHIHTHTPTKHELLLSPSIVTALELVQERDFHCKGKISFIEALELEKWSSSRPASFLLENWKYCF